jgi:hypothetical protein
MKATKTIKQDTIALLQRKRPLTYEGIVAEIQKRHPETVTSVKTVQWYASRLRAQGEEVRVKLLNDRRDWSKRPAQKPASH